MISLCHIQYSVTRPANSALTASGTVEATEILIAPEISGKVTEVLVNQGDIVKAGIIAMLPMSPP